MWTLLHHPDQEYCSQWSGANEKSEVVVVAPIMVISEDCRLCSSQPDQIGTIYLMLGSTIFIQRFSQNFILNKKHQSYLHCVITLNYQPVLLRYLWIFVDIYNTYCNSTRWLTVCGYLRWFLCCNTSCCHHHHHYAYVWRHHHCCHHHHYHNHHHYHFQ